MGVIPFEMRTPSLRGEYGFRTQEVLGNGSGVYERSFSKTDLWGLIIGNGQPPHLRTKGSLTTRYSANQSHSIRSGESFSSCHPGSWSKHAMRSHRYPEAKMLTRTAGWCAYSHSRSCHNALTLFRSMWCNTNWGDLLQPAPLSIALLGSLMVIASSTNDFCPSLPLPEHH